MFIILYAGRVYVFKQVARFGVWLIVHLGFERFISLQSIQWFTMVPKERSDDDLDAVTANSNGDRAADWAQQQREFRLFVIATVYRGT